MTLVEVIIGSAIIVSAMVSIIGVYGSLTSMSLNNTKKVQAAMLLEEGAEALRLMRDDGWTANINGLTNGTTYRLAWTSNEWRSTTTPVKVDGIFDRTFVLSAVNRDATTYDIVSSGGSLDTGTRKATVTVSWFDQTATSTRSIELYLYNTFSN